jgi:uncharacterized protein YebE (UPF0316 family)
MNLLAGSSVAPLPILPLLIFFAELSVVTISTIRIIFISRANRVLAPILGFFEICIWLFAIGQIMQNLTNVGCYVAFAAGFTIGNLFGLLIERKLAIGTLLVRIISRKEVDDLIDMLRAAEYGVTSIDAEGTTGPVKVVLTIIKRKELPNIVTIIKAFDSRAFYSIDEIQSAAAGVFPAPRRRNRGLVAGPLRMIRPAA